MCSLNNKAAPTFVLNSVIFFFEFFCSGFGQSSLHVGLNITLYPIFHLFIDSVYNVHSNVLFLQANNLHLQSCFPFNTNVAETNFHRCGVCWTPMAGPELFYAVPTVVQKESLKRIFIRFTSIFLIHLKHFQSICFIVYDIYPNLHKAELLIQKSTHQLSYSETRDIFIQISERKKKRFNLPTVPTMNSLHASEAIILADLPSLSLA